MDVFIRGEEECLDVLEQVRNRTSLFQFESSSSSQIKRLEIGLKSLVSLLVLITVWLSQASAVKAGSMMSLAIDNVGSLWMWGNVPPLDNGAESHFSLTSIPIPFPIREFYGRTVLKVACGDEHVVAIVGPAHIHKDNSYDDSVLYSWGNNHHGQLGLGDKESRARPQIVETFNQNSGLTVYDIACGAHHTALLTYRKETPKRPSICWTFGFGENGQLGHGSTKSSSIPEPVSELSEHACLVSVDCGLFHTSVVSSEGYVWSW